MISCSDPEYVQTKRIVLGLERLRFPFDELALWIETEFDVRVLNVVFHARGRDQLTRPRLQVIVEHGSEVLVIFGADGSWGSEREALIATKFRELAARGPRGLLRRMRELTRGRSFDTESMFIVFSAFAPLTRQEADAAIPEGEVEALQERLANPDLWMIKRYAGRPTFMFFTEQQAKKYEEEGLRVSYAREYFELVRQYDKYGYMKSDEYIAEFDSKENFDNNYKSNWYYFFH